MKESDALAMISWWPNGDGQVKCDGCIAAVVLNAIYHFYQNTWGDGLTANASKPPRTCFSGTKELKLLYK